MSEHDNSPQPIQAAGEPNTGHQPPTPAPQTPALPEAPSHEAPRPLAPGAFLHGEFEVKEVLSRGFTNLYLAHGGDYLSPTPLLIAECELQPNVANQSTLIGAVTQNTTDQSTLNTPLAIALADGQVQISARAVSSEETALLTDENEWAQSSESGAMSHEANVFDAPQLSNQAASSTPFDAGLPEVETVVKDEPVAAQAADVQPAEVVESSAELVPLAATEITEQKTFPPLFPEFEEWEQDERRYRAYAWDETVALQDYREPTNDLRYLQMLSTLAEGLCWAAAQNKCLDLSRELLRVESDGQLKYFGFAQPQISTDVAPLQQLQEINEFLLKHVFANSGTMRLDDQFAGLSLAHEVKEFVHRLHDGKFADLDEAVAAIKVLWPGREPRGSSYLASDVGQERELNEDSGLIFRMQRTGHLNSANWELFVVADGMGGHEGGEVASDITIRALAAIQKSRTGR